MKRWISLLMVMALLLGLCACGGKEPTASPDNTSQSAVLPSEASSAASGEGTAADGEMADAYVTVEKTETQYGLIQIPQIDETKLDSEDVRLANATFRDIRDWVLEQVEECKKELGGEPYHDAAEPLCITRYAQNGSVLSVTVKYIGLYPYSTEMDYYEAVNIDIPTGKALNNYDVIKAAGFSEDEVKASLRLYALNFMFFEWEHNVFYSLAADGEMPDGLGDPSHGWQEELDAIAQDYDKQALPLGGPFDGQSRYLPVYAGEDGLEVCVRVPTAAGGGSYDTMVRIGHNDSETVLFNPDTPSGMPFGRGALLPDAAREVVARSLGFDDTYTDGDGVQYSIGAEKMEIIEGDEQYDPSYVFRVYTDEGDHIATAGWYAVGVFTGTLWEMDIISGEWSPVMNGTGPLSEEFVSGAIMNGALASVLIEPSEYEHWAANPVTEVDLIALASGTRYYESLGKSLLLLACQDNTVISFESGIMEGDGFIPQTQLWSLTLNTGEIVSVILDRPKVPNQAIIVSAPDDIGTYIIQYYDPDHVPQIEYIMSDSAMG